MGAYPVKLVYEGKAYYVGFSDTTDQYWSPAYEDPKKLNERFKKDLERGIGVDPEDLPGDKDTPVHTVDEEDIKRTKDSLEDLMKGITEFPSETLVSIKRVFDFLVNAFGLHNHEVITGEETKQWAKELGFEEKRVNEPGNIAWDSVDDLTSLEMKASRERFDEKEAKIAGRYLKALLKKAGFLNDPPTTPIELLEKLYK